MIASFLWFVQSRIMKADRLHIRTVKEVRMTMGAEAVISHKISCVPKLIQEIENSLSDHDRTA